MKLSKQAITRMIGRCCGERVEIFTAHKIGNIAERPAPSTYRKYRRRWFSFVVPTGSQPPYANNLKPEFFPPIS
jgi:hypothetical protein